MPHPTPQNPTLNAQMMRYHHCGYVMLYSTVDLNREIILGVGGGGEDD